MSESVSIYFSDFIDGWVEALLVSGSGLPRFVLPLKFSANFFQSFGGVGKRVVPGIEARLCKIANLLNPTPTDFKGPINSIFIGEIFLVLLHQSTWELLGNEENRLKRQRINIYYKWSSDKSGSVGAHFNWIFV